MGHCFCLLCGARDAGVDGHDPRRQGNEVLANRGETRLRLRYFSFRLCVDSTDWLCVLGCEAPRYALRDVDLARGFNPQWHRDNHLLHSARCAAAALSWMFNTGKIRIRFLPILRNSDEAHLSQLRPGCGARLDELSRGRFKTACCDHDSSHGVALWGGVKTTLQHTPVMHSRL